MISHTPILNDTLCGRKRERARDQGRHARTPVFSCAHYFQAPATQATYSALSLPLVLDSCCEVGHSKLIILHRKVRIRFALKKSFLNFRVRSRPPTQGL